MREAAEKEGDLGEEGPTSTAEAGDGTPEAAPSTSAYPVLKFRNYNVKDAESMQHVKVGCLGAMGLECMQWPGVLSQHGEDNRWRSMCALHSELSTLAPDRDMQHAQVEAAKVPEVEEIVADPEAVMGNDPEVRNALLMAEASCKPALVMEWTSQVHAAVSAPNSAPHPPGSTGGADQRGPQEGQLGASKSHRPAARQARPADSGSHDHTHEGRASQRCCGLTRQMFVLGTPEPFSTKTHQQLCGDFSSVTRLNALSMHCQSSAVSDVPTASGRGGARPRSDGSARIDTGRQQGVGGWRAGGLRSSQR